MCGILGIIDPKDEEVVKDMAEAILHRGPDDNGFFRDDLVALGMQRLAIIDLKSGSQPIFSTDRRYLIFLNGEIYNYKELKARLLQKGSKFKTQSDTEVALKMYEEYGFEAFEELRGMFAMAIYDRDEDKLVLARDRFGIKPLYYYKEGNKVKAFSSEIKSFLALENFKAKVNDEAVYNYLSFQYNPLTETFFKGVYKVPPASIITIKLKTGEREEKKYWRFEFKTDKSLSESKTIEQIRGVLEDSVAHHMISDVPVGVFLSGGIDSSIIATLMSRLNNASRKKIKTFTVGFEALNEWQEAKETSELLGTDHREIRVSPEKYFASLQKVAWHFDEPVADPSAVGLYFLSHEAAKHVKVVLSGEGADELFGGYNIYLAPIRARRLRWLPKFIIKIFLDLPFEFFGKNYLRRVVTKLEDWFIGNASIFSKEEMNKLWKGAQKPINLKPLYAETRDLTDSTKMQYIDINTWLVGNILAKADRMSMAHSLELRVPFLDKEVASLASGLRDSFKWRGSTTKYILRQAFKKLLPERVLERRKLGFPTPIRDWFTKDRIKVYRTILDNKYIKEHFDTDYINKLISDHVSKKLDNSRKIFLLLMLSLWYNVFIEETWITLEAKNTKPQA